MSPTGFHMQNRVSIKRSPAFRTGTKVEALAVNKKPSLKRKPGVDRSSKPSNIQLATNATSSGGAETLRADTYHAQLDIVVRPTDIQVEEALKAPLPTGPAPKKPPRTFMHDLYVESKNGGAQPPEQLSTAAEMSSPQRPVRRKSIKNSARPVSVPLFAMTRSKTEPSIVGRGKRRPSAVTTSSSPPPPPLVASSRAPTSPVAATPARSASIPQEKPTLPLWQSELVQCRWQNPVQWNSFSPPKKSKSAGSGAGHSSSSDSVSASRERVSTSLLTIIDQTKSPNHRRTPVQALTTRGLSSTSSLSRSKLNSTSAINNNNNNSNNNNNNDNSNNIINNNNNHANQVPVKGRNRFERPANEEFHFSSSTANLMVRHNSKGHIYDQPAVDTDLHYMVIFFEIIFFFRSLLFLFFFWLNLVPSLVPPPSPFLLPFCMC